MGFLIVLPFTCLAGYTILSIRRWLVSIPDAGRWMKSFRIVTMIGALLGMIFALVVHYSVANARIEGFPIPVSMSNRATPDDPWLTSTIPASLKITAQVTDVLYGVLVCLGPLAGFAFLQQHRSKISNTTANPETRP